MNWSIQSPRTRQLLPAMMTRDLKDMKTSRRVLAGQIFGVSFLLFSQTCANAGDVSGTWETDYGTIKFIPTSGNQVTGTYDNKSARITGTFEGGLLKGHWVRPGTQGSCRPLYGETNWGRVVFKFNDNFTAFYGNFDYCDNSPSKGWEGVKTCNYADAPRGTWTTSYGDMIFPENPGSNYEAPYDQGTALVTGTISQRTLTGKWERESDVVACEERYHGKDYWGAISFEFNADFTSFRGVWGYCDNESDKPWTGYRICEPQGGVPPPAEITDVRIVSTEEPHDPIPNVRIDDSFRVKVTFDVVPKEPLTVDITSTDDPATLQVETFRTDEPTTYLSEPVLVKDSSSAPLVSP